MPSGTAARRYAQAVFELADEQGTLDRWERDLSILADAFGDPMVAAFFDNPQVPNTQKRETVARLLGPDGQQLTKNFAGLLIERGRFGAMRQIYNAFHDQVLARRGIAVGDVTTAVPLNDAELTFVRDRLSAIVGKDVEVRATVDPGIIGGIIARVDDQLIDGSVTNQLRKLRERLVARR
ncbi:MAG: F0F1 ATP synthase subunit delta [Thermomicrobiales bacterium]